jgi:hypothetical protein
VIFLQFSFLVVQSTNKFTGGINRFISVTVCKGGQISIKFSGLSLSTLKTVRLPIPNKDDVESHLVMACAAGKMLHKTGLRMLKIECTEMKTPILGVCDRTRMKP